MNRIDSWFARISQGLARDRVSTTDNKEDIRYAVKKVNQYFYAGKVFWFFENKFQYYFFVLKEKPTIEVITKYANVIVDLLLSMHNYPDDFEFLGQILNIIREILDCDKSMFIKLINFNIKIGILK